MQNMKQKKEKLEVGQKLKMVLRGCTSTQHTGINCIAVSGFLQFGFLLHSLELLYTHKRICIFFSIKWINDNGILYTVSNFSFPEQLPICFDNSYKNFE